MQVSKDILDQLIINEDGTSIARASDGKKLKYCEKGGYYYVHFKGGKYKVADIVASKYVDNPENKPIANHKDRDKLNDHYKNLEWTTHAENIRHALKKENLGKQGKVYGYVRVSTDSQAKEDKFGIKAQKNAILDWANKEGFEVVEFFVDKGFSGSTQHRPHLQRLLKVVKSKVAPVVVAKFDRWARDTYLHLFLEKELVKANSKLLSVAESSFNNTDNPANQLLREIMMSFAKFESRRIATRMSHGRLEKAKEGGHATGRTPYGYNKDEKTGKLEVNEDEAEVVRMMFRDRKSGCSLRKIAEILNDMNIKTKKGNKWRAKSVSNILKNKKYRGIVEQTIAGETITRTNEKLKIV